MEFENAIPATDLSSLTPLDLAAEFSIDLLMKGTMDRDERLAGMRTTRMLQEMADFGGLGLVGTDYVVQSRRSMLLPQVQEPGRDVAIIDFDELAFEGTFSEYAIVRIRMMMGRSSVRALCLEFSDVTLLPGLDRVDDALTMFVPVHDITSIERTAA